jgi:hypothetical protein
VFRFKSDIVVECVPYRAGDVVSAGEIPAGSLESLTRMRLVEPYTPPAAPPPEPPAVEPQVIETPKPAAKKAAKAASAPSE